MSRARHMPAIAAIVAGIVVALSAPAQHTGANGSSVHRAISADLLTDWDSAFADRSGKTPVHFVASYVDGHGQTHRLEEWRIDVMHLRRVTDARIDLHADAVGHALSGQPRDYVWQVLDLKTKIDHRVSTQGMLRLGMLYSYYDMAHGLSRPAGEVTVHAMPDRGASDWHGRHTAWFQIDAVGQPSLRVCWLPGAGVPLRIDRQAAIGWETTFTLQLLETRPIPAAVFAVDTAAFHVRDVDEASAED